MNAASVLTLGRAATGVCELRMAPEVVRRHSYGKCVPLGLAPPPCPPVVPPLSSLPCRHVG